MHISCSWFGSILIWIHTRSEPHQRQSQKCSNSIVKSRFIDPLTSLYLIFEPICPFPSDIWHKQSLFVHTSAARWILFSPFWTFVSTWQMVAFENPRISAASEILKPVCLAPKSILIICLNCSESSSPCLNALMQIAATTWFAICFNKQLNIMWPVSVGGYTGSFFCPVSLMLVICVD